MADLVTAITGRGRFPRSGRGSWQGEAPDGPVRLAGGLRWSASSSGVRAGSAWIGGELFEDSIVVRPASPTATVSFVTMDLGGLYQRLRAVAGVLDDATEPFQVGHFRVVVDGTPRWESQALLEKPVTVDVDVAGATTLRLEMCRPCTRSAPLHSPVDSPLHSPVDSSLGSSLGSPLGSGWRVSGRLPELGWGNPTLSR
jgi:hypothetical protein